jgi:outer membrane protein TolC
MLSGYTLLSVAVPLVDSGATRGRVRAARAQAASAETTRRSEIDTITLEVRQVWISLIQYQEQVATARQELAQADEAYRLARLRYEAGVTSQSGVSPLIELSNAEKSLAQAESDYVNALYDYNGGRSALDKAVGRYAYAAGAPGYRAAPDPVRVGATPK